MPIPVLKRDVETAAELVAGPVYELACMIGNAIAAERERCARVAEIFSDQGRDGHQIAKQIREG